MLARLPRTCKPGTCCKGKHNHAGAWLEARLRLNHRPASSSLELMICVSCSLELS